MTSVIASNGPLTFSKVASHQEILNAEDVDPDRLVRCGMRTPAPRIYAICATDAPVAALLVRTSGWHLAARWDLESGNVTLGQWLRGNVYARRCDLSPNGEFLYCFAMKSGHAYHAVSRLPWLTALAFWN